MGGHKGVSPGLTVLRLSRTAQTHTSGLALCSSFRTPPSRHGRFAAGSDSPSPAARDAMAGVGVGVRVGVLRFLDAGSGAGDAARGAVCGAAANALIGLCGVDCFSP